MTTIAQLVVILGLLGTVLGVGMRLGRAEDAIKDNEDKLTKHGQVITLLRGQYAQHESLMATYAAWCHTGKFPANSAECVQAQVWEKNKLSGAN